MSKKYLLGFVFVFLFFVPLILLADGEGVQLQSPISAGSIYDVLQSILGWLFKLSIPLVAIIAVWAGFSFMTAAGEPEKIKKARGILLYAAIGFAVILVSNGVVYLVGDILGVKVETAKEGGAAGVHIPTGIGGDQVEAAGALPVENLNEVPPPPQ